jgi:PglZ domain-containing protein
MAKWRDEIIRKFTPSVGRSVVVADPDRLLTEPALNEALRGAGFDLLIFEEPIAFRFAYESKHRSRIDNGQLSDLIILYQGDSGQSLPFDVVARSENVALSLTDFFPNLSYPVISALEPEYLDTLYEAQDRFNPGVLGDNATKDFVLRHVFEIAAELVRSDADLLRVLLRRHYRSQAIPALFIDRLVQVLGGTHLFEEWPLDLLFTNRAVFFSFLQERWPAFLNERFGRPDVTSALSVPGPSRLPFDSPDVRVYMDNLFTEGLLQPVQCESTDAITGWIAVGIRRDPRQEALERFEHLLALVESSLPGSAARHGDWQRFAEIWAQFINVTCSVKYGSGDTHESGLRVIRERVDAEFTAWMLKRFGSLHNLPSSPPAMVHHIARQLAHQRAATTERIALLVIDGLALDQWITLRDQISAQRPKWQFDENTVFAWVPSVTSVSRQSIFAARAPFYFPASIYTTEREAGAWAQFWADQGLSSAEVAYVKGLGDDDSLRVLDDVLSHRVSVLGAVVDKVDRIMHGMELGTAGMHNQVAQWGGTGFLVSAITMLVTAGFDVYITSDHGNVEATGLGRPREGMLADVKGERVRIFPNEMLRAATASKFDSAIPWAPLGLPDQYFPLLAPGRFAFIPSGHITVAHGGITIEEVIVPFVHVAGVIE